MKKIIIFISILALLLLTVSPAAFAQDYSSYLDLKCGVNYMESLDNGEVVVSRNSTQRVAPASITKITTALVVLQNCKNLYSIVTVSENAINYLKNTDSSLAGIKAGEQLSVLNLLYCLLVPSGNDAAIVLAEYIGGTQEKFVAMMNDCVKKLGCKNTHYANSHGLDDPNHYTTAEDIALIAKAAMKYNIFKTIVLTPTYKLPQTNMNKERTLINTNFMINKAYVTYYRDFIKGIKTGHTDNSGHCVVTYASKDGFNYLAVVMKGEYMDTDADKIEENQAFMDTIKMYEWAFDNLSYELVAPADLIVTDVKVNYSWKADHMRLVPEKDLRALVPTGTNEGSVVIEPIKKPAEVNAPIKKGEVACKANVIYADSTIATINLVYGESVGRNHLLFAIAMIKKLFSHIITKIIIGLVLVGLAIYIAYVVHYNSAKGRKMRKQKQLRLVKFDNPPQKKEPKGRYKPKHK